MMFKKQNICSFTQNAELEGVKSKIWSPNMGPLHHRVASSLVSLNNIELKKKKKKRDEF